MQLAIRCIRVFRKIKDNIKKMAPGLELELAKYILITVVATVGLFLAQQIPQISVTFKQMLSISIFNFLIIIFLTAISSSRLTYIHLIRKIKSLELSAGTDDLTGVYSNKVLKPKIEKEIESVKANKKPLSIILIDIDGFKRINDTYGYNKADLVLKEFAQTLKADIRGSTDALFRYKHGDEFLIVAPGTEGDKARVFAERLRNTILNHEFQIDHNYESLTMSAGITELNNENEMANDFFKRVEEALFEAKKQRNRTFLISKKIED
jgi:diguanylate cyclase (GGDEF)-like protein